MSKTVGYPLAIAAMMVLKGEHEVPAGLHIPTIPSIYAPVLRELKRLNVSFDEVLEEK